MDADTAIKTITNALLGQPAVRALFLSGSHATGHHDAYSDIDFVLVATEGATDAIARLWQETVTAVGPLMLWRDRKVRPLLINAITADFLRIDAIILKPDQLAAYTQETLSVLFDHDGLHANLTESRPRTPPNRDHVRYQFEEFIRILALLPVGIGRKEYVNGITGIFHLRNLLIDLLIEETGVQHRGGALHLNRLVTADQLELLAGLPVPAPTREAVIEANLAYACAYLPRARRLAKHWGVEWPTRFEAATWQYLKDTLAIDKPSEA